MKLLGWVFLLLTVLASGFGLGVLASGWVSTDWPGIDDTDQAGA